MFLRTIEDLEASERVPLATRLGVNSTYAFIREVASRDPERMAIPFHSGTAPSARPAGISYRVLLSGLHQTANLLADLSIEPGDVIALLLPQFLETHLLFWGGQAAGIVCPLSPWFPTEQIVALLQAVKAKLLVAAGPQVSLDLWHLAESLRREVPSITTVLQVGGAGKERDGVYAFNMLREEYPADRLSTGRDIALDDMAAYFPTVATTGTPGFIPLTHANLLYAAWALGMVTRLASEDVLLRGFWHCMQASW